MRSLHRSDRNMRLIRLAQYGLTTVGILALGYCLALYVEGTIFETREAHHFAQERPQITAVKETSSVPTASATLPQDGAVVGQLEIPRVGLSVMVIEGTEDGDLKKAAGHIPGTALPGQPGNVAIAGHRDTFFRPLRNIQQRDTMILNTRKGAYRYRVVSTSIVWPEDIQVLYPTARDTLTLVTCFPFDYIGSAPKRFIVRAERTQE
jgi:sortase A